MRKQLVGFFLVVLTAFTSGLRAEGLNPDVQKKVEALMQQARSWAAAPQIHDAVLAQNKHTPEAFVSMTEEKWKSLPIMDPFVHAFTVNPAAKFLKQKKTEAVSEAFVSDANGYKVAFLAKTTSWSHHGTPKHEIPMSGKTWQGRLEIDQSSGMQQLQFSVPVLDGDKPIGSLVIGIALSALTAP